VDVISCTDVIQATGCQWKKLSHIHRDSLQHILDTKLYPLYWTVVKCVFHIYFLLIDGTSYRDKQAASQRHFSGWERLQSFGFK